MNNLLLLFTLALSIPVFSQVKEVGSPSEPKQRFSLGVIGGLNICRMPF